MAKKSLKKRIDDLVNALGRAEKPTFAEIRSELVALGAIAQELEDGQALAEKKAAIAALVEENKNLKVELQSANLELDAFRAERKKQEEKKRRQDIPEIQFKILRRLPTENVGGNWLSIFNVSRSLKIPPEEVEIHLHGLRNAGLVTPRQNPSGELLWHRSIKGSQLVLARRLAGEEDTAVTQYPDLPAVEEAILSFMLREETMGEDGVNEQTIHEVLHEMNEYRLTKVSLEEVKWTLKGLKAKGFVDFDPEETIAMDTGGGYTWHITEAVTDYFAERGEL